jgi:hypothetical protein
MNGKTMLTKSAVITNGEIIIQFDISKLSSGAYLIKTLSADGKENAIKKFIKE